MAMRTKLRRLLGAARHAATGLLVLALLWAPAASEACSQCLATRSRENQLAFIVTTIFLSIMPLVLVGGIVLWLRRQLKAAEERPARASLPTSDEISQISPPAPIHS